MNLPILHLLEDSERILLVGMGGGFDVYGALPLMYDLQELRNKGGIDSPQIILGSLNTSDCKEFTIFDKDASEPHCEIYPESSLKRHLYESGERIQMYTFPKTGVKQLTTNLAVAVTTHGIDTIILVDGGVDSLMRGDEVGSGTLLEDSVMLTAAKTVVQQQGIKTAILACVGFGCELEEELDHYRALENMADLIMDGSFYGACALTQGTQLNLYGKACESAWAVGRKSHIHTRVISAAIGMFGDQNAYGSTEARVFGSKEEKNFITPLMSLYWFFDMHKVADKNLLVEHLQNTNTFTDVVMVYRQILPKLMQNRKERKQLPY